MTTATLPSPPEHPERPPPMRLEHEREVTIPPIRADGPVLAAMWAPRTGDRVLVLAHPHPLYGGTMHNAVVTSLARAAASAEVSTLRFNFRGVERSEGRFEHGDGEIDDVRAALAFARRERPGIPIDLLGYSIGAYVALAAVAAGEPVHALVLLSPAVTVFDHLAPSRWPPGSSLAAPCLVSIGTHDDFTDIAEARSFAARIGARFEPFEGADHYLVAERRAVAARIVSALGAIP